MQQTAISRSMQLRLCCSAGLRLVCSARLTWTVTGHCRHCRAHSLLQLTGRPSRQQGLWTGCVPCRASSAAGLLGSQATPLALTLPLGVQIKYPENFFLLRGNHESASINRIYGFYDECKRRYNVRLWKTFTDCFNCLPVAALIDEKVSTGSYAPEECAQCTPAGCSINGFHSCWSAASTSTFCFCSWLQSSTDATVTYASRCSLADNGPAGQQDGQSCVAAILLHVLTNTVRTDPVHARRLVAGAEGDGPDTARRAASRRARLGPPVRPALVRS